MRKLSRTGILLLVFTLLFLTGCGTTGQNQTLSAQESRTESITATETPLSNAFVDEQPEQPKTQELITSADPVVEQISNKEVETPAKLEPLQVTVFDVGQADCILIRVGEHSALIDAGDIGQDYLITNYLSDAQVRKLDYLVATHPHADHIGSMPAVIRDMENIGTVLMPDVVHTTDTFERLLDAIEEKDLSVTIPEAGEVFELGAASLQVLAPNKDSYEDINNYSLVLRLTYGQVGFLLTGDAEDVSESEQLAENYILDANVLKVGHHGSGSSTTRSYLNAISPKFAAISVGVDNTYGHPDATVMEILNEAGCTVYRTDKDGTITFTTDGVDIEVETNKAKETLKTPTESESFTTPEPQASIAKASTQYIGNINSNIFHVQSCGTLPAEKNRVCFEMREEAISANYRPCKNCKP